MNNNQIQQAKRNLEGLLRREEFQRSLADVAPKHITKERIVKLALVAASRQPKLFECTPQSFLQSVMKSAELGLDCVGTLGQGYLVPYYNGKIKAFECQFIVGYQGLIELARRSGNISRIESRVVYEKDEFVVEYGLEPKLIHKPYLGGDRGKIVCVYAIAELKDGSRQVEVMTLDEVERIRDRSKAKEGGPWVTDFAEMARKTVIRRLAKYLPLSPELAKAIETDDQQFDYHGAPLDVAADIQAGIDGLKKRLKKKIDSAEIADAEPEQVEDDNKPEEINKPEETKQQNDETEVPFGD